MENVLVRCIYRYHPTDENVSRNISVIKIARNVGFYRLFCLLKRADVNKNAFNHFNLNAKYDRSNYLIYSRTMVLSRCKLNYIIEMKAIMLVTKVTPCGRDKKLSDIYLKWSAFVNVFR